LRCVPSVLFLG